MDLDLSSKVWPVHFWASSCWSISLLELVSEDVGCVDAAVVNGGCDRMGASGMGNGE